jgi:hypothetical protein
MRKSVCYSINVCPVSGRLFGDPSKLAPGTTAPLVLPKGQPWLLQRIVRSIYADVICLLVLVKWGNMCSMCVSELIMSVKKEDLSMHSAYTQALPCTSFRTTWNSVHLTCIVWSSVSCVSCEWGESSLERKLGEVRVHHHERPFD